jgi:hypothetical protein
MDSGASSRMPRSSTPTAVVTFWVKHLDTARPFWGGKVLTTLVRKGEDSEVEFHSRQCYRRSNEGRQVQRAPTVMKDVKDMVSFEMYDVSFSEILSPYEPQTCGLTSTSRIAQRIAM